VAIVGPFLVHEGEEKKTNKGGGQPPSVLPRISRGKHSGKWGIYLYPTSGERCNYFSSISEGNSKLKGVIYPYWKKGEMRTITLPFHDLEGIVRETAKGSHVRSSGKEDRKILRGKEWQGEDVYFHFEKKLCS